MHLPFSHLFESILVNQKGFHEELVKNALLIDTDIGNILNRIDPELRNTIRKHLDNSIFSSLNASSFDLDRFDYITKAAFFNGNLLYNSTFPSFTLEKFEINGELKVVPVFNIKDYMRIIENLKYRADLYKGYLGYLSPEVVLTDYVFGVGLKKVIDNTDIDSIKKLKNFISTLTLESSEQKIDANNINIQEALKWDDINMINCILDYAESLDETTDVSTIKLIALMLPQLESLMHMISSMKYNSDIISESDSEYIKARKKDDLKLIKRINRYITSESLLAKCLKDKEFFSKNILFISNPDANEKTHIDNTSTFYEERTFKEYNPDEPIFIKLETGEICTIDKVPGKEFPLSTDVEIISYLYTILPLTEMQKELKSDPLVQHGPVINYPNYTYKVSKTFNSDDIRAS